MTPTRELPTSVPGSSYFALCGAAVVIEGAA